MFDIFRGIELLYLTAEPYRICACVKGFDSGDTSEAGAIFGGRGGGSNLRFNVAPYISLNLLLTALGFSILIAAIAGLYPSWKASKMSPVDALRAE